ncbi:MAG: SDR family oxidoreductase [Bacteroidales bacterium]|jgi:NAD(P)-dependent dehydrogenase (short-subunit alcohol dehydrogenase family)|nr:SDR family oxidoreductase [Bacteroidales bacterium]
MNDFNDLKGNVAVITGGSGVIGQALVKGLCTAGVKVVILDVNPARGAETAAEFARRPDCGSATGIGADVTDRESLLKAREEIRSKFGTIDILINCAGGNKATATTRKERIIAGDNDLEGTFFSLDINGFDGVFDLNFKGTVLPTMILSEDMVRKGKGNILNISSMNAFRPLTKIPAYSAAKAAINNFTQWLAVHFAPAGVRVNAIAPGFLLTSQNRFLLTDEQTGEMTQRGAKIIAATPMGRYAEPEELVGTMLYLLSDTSSFVTGAVIPVDGGFSAYSGV